jgi:hypothetical protein
VVPYSKKAVVSKPLGLMEPFSCAEVVVTAAAARVWTLGAPLPAVVKVVSFPLLVPLLFEATMRKWYGMFAARPVTVKPMF